jgi:hypothetical protein
MIQVKTAEAAGIAGVGYEGFRSWLKRGLLKSTGLLPKFYAPDAGAEIADAKRWQWSSFGFADLCAFRLAKILFDSGFEWNVVNSIASDNELWQSQYREQVKAELAERANGPDLDLEKYYIAIFGHGSQWTLYSPAELMEDLRSGIVNREWMILVDLRELRHSVVTRIEEVVHAAGTYA